MSEDNSSSSPEGKTDEAATVRGGYYRKTSCSFCSSSVFLRGEDTPQENEMRSLLLKTMCLQMPPTNHKIPSQCSRTTFSLCESCLRLAEALLKIQNEVEALFKVRDKILEAIRLKTEEGMSADDLIHDNEELTPTTPLGYQIRKMILASTRCRSGFSRVVPENASESGGQPINLQTEAKSIENESWEEDIAVDSTSSELPQVSNSLSKDTTILEAASGISGGGNKESLETQADGDHDLERIIERLEANGVKIHVNGGDMDGSKCGAAIQRKILSPQSTPKTTGAEDSQEKPQPPSLQLETNDDLFEILLEKSKIVVDGVNLSLCTGFQGSDKSKNYNELVRSTSSEDDGSSSSLAKTKVHVLNQHKKQTKAKKSPSTCSSNVSTRNPQDNDPFLPIYNPIIRIPKFDAPFPQRKEPKMTSLLPISLETQKILQKSARELEDARLMPPPPPPPKRKRTIPT